MTITLSADQALVLSNWLERMENSAEFYRVVDDRAVWSALFAISATLDTNVDAIFAADYTDRLAAARRRLGDELGEMDLSSP
ncbi:MAG: hypothetical protein GEV10_31280 [Streptosporangiales bacterium]|nr:hypothetical protein [Streptosporangiales bacterium]